MKKITLLKSLFVAVMLSLFSFAVFGEEATLTFDNVSKRTVFTTSQQVWSENGVTLTNDKASSTSNVADYSKPARFYKSSKITVKAPGKMTQIVFVCNTASYANALQSSISGASVASDKVTVTLDGSSDTYVISSLSGGQVRMDALTVTYSTGDVVLPTIVAPTFSVGTSKFSEPFDLKITCATEDAKIYYTLTEGGEFVEYTKAINISATTTVYAKAVLGEDESEIVSATYTYVNPIVTIAEFLAAEENDGVLYELTGVVYDIYNTSYGNFYLTNETDTVLVYGLKASATAGNQSFAQIEGLDEGDTLTLRGYRAAYNGKAQVGSAYYVSHKDYVEPAPAITATWNIEEGAVLESFESATITFTGVDDATTTSMYPACFYKVAEDGTLALVENYCTAGVLDRTATGASIKLWVDEDAGCYEGKITAGNYRIVLSAGMVKFNNDNSNKNTEEYVLNFSIVGSDEPTLEEIDAVYTVNPENNATVTEIREIVLNFTDYETISVAELDLDMGTNVPQFTKYDADFDLYQPCGYIFFKADTASANGLRLYIPSEFMGGTDAIAVEGQYQIVIPAGVVTFADGISKAITLNYTVKAEEVVEPTPTIVEGTKLYIQLPATYTVANSSVTFGEKATGGKLSPVKRGIAIGGTTTGTAMTEVDAENGVWEVVAPAGTSDSLFSVAFSFKGYTAACNIANLKYDGEHNLFTLSSDFVFDIRKGGTATEANGTWGVYPFPEPQVITATWSIEEGAVIESFSGVTITFGGVDHLGRKVDGVEVTKVYPLISTTATFFRVAEDGTTTPVVAEEMEGYDGVLKSSANACVTTLSLADRYTVVDGAYRKKGNYRIVLPGAKVQLQPKVDDAQVYSQQDFVLNFTIQNDDAEVVEPTEVEAAYTVDPATGNVKAISTVALTFTDATALTLAEIGENPNPTTWAFCNQVVEYEDMGTMAQPVAPMVASVEGNKLILTIGSQFIGGQESLTTPGNYSVTIPAGLVFFDEAHINKAITLNYTITEPVITAMEAKNAYAYDVVVEVNDELTKATVSYRLNAPAVAVKVQATVNGEVVREVEGTTVCRYADGVADNLNTVEVSLEGLGGNVVFQVAVEGTLVETPTEVTKAYQFYHPKGVEVDANPESEFFGRVYATEGMPVAKAGDKYISDVNGNGVGQGLYAFDATLTPIANKDGKYGFTGGLTFNSLNPAGKSDYAPLRVVLSEDGRLFFSRQSVGVSPLVEVNPADLDANFTEVFTGFVCDSTTYDLNTSEGAFMAAPNVGFDVKGTGEDLKVLMLSTKVGGWAAAKSAFRVDEYNLGTATTWSAAPSTAVEALSGQYIVTYTSSNVEYDNEGGMWLIQHRGTPSASEPALVHLNAAGEVDYTNTSINAAASGFAFNADYTLLAFAGNGNQKCTIYEVGKDAEGAPTLTEKYNFATTIGTNLNDIAWDYADNLYIVGNSGEWLKVFALPRESAVVTTPAAARYTVELPLPMEVEFANIAAIYEMGMWDMAYYESYDNNNVVAKLKSQPTVVEVVKSAGGMGNINNYYLNDGTGVIVLQAEGDRYEYKTNDDWETFYIDTVPGLEIAVGQKLPADLMANINFQCVTDEETWLPTGEVYGAPVMMYVPKATGETDAEGYPVTESNEAFAARCEASDFVETATEVTVDELLANRLDYAGQLLTLNAESNYYCASEMDYLTGAMKTTAYMYWDAETAFDVEVYDGVTYVYPKMTEDYTNYAGKVLNVLGDEFPNASLEDGKTINVVTARFDWNSIAMGQSLLAKDFEIKDASEGPGVDVENGELVVNVYSNNGNVYVETEAGVMIEVYTVNGLRVYAGVSTTNTTVIEGLNTNMAIIRVNGVAYKVFVK